MSESFKFSPEEIKVWLERETGSIFVPVHAKAQKLLDETKRTLENLSETSEALLDNSAKEIERRNMKTYGRARAMNKLAKLFVDRNRQVKVPDKVAYDSLNGFVQETQRMFTATEIDVKNFFPRISPFFILDRRRYLATFERAKTSLEELRSFLARDYVKTKTLEDTFRLIDKLTTLEAQYEVLDERGMKVKADIVAVDRQITETEQRMAGLKTAGTIGQLSKTGTEIETLSVEVKHSLQHLQKPFIKLQSLATHGSGSGLTPEEVGKLSQYLENPFEALASEDARYPLLRQILQKLHRAILEDKLKLKPEKARKAEQTINSILNGDSLATLHQRCRDATKRKAQLSASEEVAAMQKDLARLGENVENLARHRRVLEAEESSIRRNCGETAERIRNHKSEIEKNIFSFLGRKVVVT